LKEPPFFSLSSLVQAAAAAIIPRLDMPFALFGHSMGSLIAFELARLIRRECGLSPVHMFVSGRGAPHTAGSEPVRHTLPDHEFMESLRELNGMPEEVLAHGELMGVLLPILRADFSVCETYEYSPDVPLDCPITAFGGLQDRAVTREDLQSWREQTRGAFRLRMIPGDHFFVNSARPLVIGSVAQDLYEVAINPKRRTRH
jgi:surfactin synthase thioesterase subunit